MTFKSLLDIYKDAKLLDSPEQKEGYLTLHSGSEFITIPIDNISSTEAQLLLNLYPLDSNQSKWYQYLIQNKPMVSNVETAFRVIQFKTALRGSETTIWLNTLSSFFTDVEDAFFTSEHEGLIIIRDELIDSNSLSGFLLTFDDDFSSKTSLYIGEAKTIDLSYPELVREERSLYDNVRPDKNVLTFKDIYLECFVKPQFQNSHIMEELKHKILKQHDAKSLIQSLWKNQANISQTSKDLFLHRNTLNYRLDKFQEEVGLSLRDLDDLLLCFLIIV